jgi:hypothetical protein
MAAGPHQCRAHTKKTALAEMPLPDGTSRGSEDRREEDLSSL